MPILCPFQFDKDTYVSLPSCVPSSFFYSNSYCDLTRSVNLSYITKDWKRILSGDL